MFALNNHIRHLHNRINLLISSSAEVRYLDFIKLYPNIIARVPQWMIASYLGITRSEEHTSELQSRGHLVCRLLLEKKKKLCKTEISNQNVIMTTCNCKMS